MCWCQASKDVHRLTSGHYLFLDQCLSFILDGACQKFRENQQTGLPNAERNHIYFPSCVSRAPWYLAGSNATGSQAPQPRMNTPKAPHHVIPLRHLPGDDGEENGNYYIVPWSSFGDTGRENGNYYTMVKDILITFVYNLSNILIVVAPFNIPFQTPPEAPGSKI